VVPELSQLRAEHLAALGPVVLHGPRQRVRVLAASTRRAVDLVQNRGLVPEFGTRLVWRAADEEETILALIGSRCATQLGPGGRLRMQWEGRVALEAYGYPLTG